MPPDIRVFSGFYKEGMVHHLCFTSEEPHTVNAKETGCFAFSKVREREQACIC